jgi:hypothetical protein
MVERYNYRLRKQTDVLEDFLSFQKDIAEMLVTHYKQANTEMPDDIYRAAAYFINDEFNQKSGSLVLLLQTNERLNEELPRVTKETFVMQHCYRFQVFAAALQEGGY